jgi:hypothetical protein
MRSSSDTSAYRGFEGGGGPVVAPPRSRPTDGRWAVLEGMMLLAGVVLRTMLPLKVDATWVKEEGNWGTQSRTHACERTHVKAALMVQNFYFLVKMKL